MNKRSMIILIIGIVIAFFGCALTLYIVNRDLNKPEDVLKQYMSCINEQKYEEMYEMLSEESKSKTDKETFITRNKNIYEGIEVQNISVKDIVQDENDKNKFSYQMEMNTVAGEISFDNTITFSKQNDKKYYINWDSGLIFPELTENDKVRVDTVQGTRGRILDRNNIVLAEQGTIKQVGFVPRKDCK